METVNKNELKELLEAQAHVWRYTFNYITSMSLKCAVQLGIPDIISSKDKPVTLSELVTTLSIPNLKSAYVYRLMRILVHCGFFTIENFSERQEGYILTSSSKLLLKNSARNISPFLSMITDPAIVTPFHFMTTFFQGSSSTPLEAAYGMSIWKYCDEHPEFRKCFQEAMTSDTEFLMDAILKDFKKLFEGSTSLVDVGGGIGTAAKAVSEAFPNMRCTVFDLPNVVANLEGSRNVQFVAGDMFELIPSADIILLKWIMHGWSDEECMKILKRCREAISSKDNGGKVIILETVIDCEKGEFQSTESQLCLDILMMVVATGKERTETEWEKLFLEAGFTSYTITHALGIRSIIEVFP